ncbi:MAG: hypothetical protein JKX76_01510 [Colwellia sp.]|nr:hypothetical protein [Colwellia sp.]
MFQQQITQLTALKDTLVSFLESLIEILPDEGELNIAHVYINNQADMQQSMLHIVRNLVPHKKDLGKCIRNTDLCKNASFVTDGSIYGGTIKDLAIVEHYKELWLGNTLSSQHRVAILKWSYKLILVAEKYMQVSGIENPEDVS